MISLTVVLIIIFVHWVADFVLQTDKQARGKSKNWGDLLSHVLVYTSCWAVPFLLIVFLGNNNGGPKAEELGWYFPILWFFPITFICHTITDYFTSRLNTKLWESGQVHNFFVSVGFDQVLHYVQLFLTYYFLTK